MLFDLLDLSTRIGKVLTSESRTIAVAESLTAGQMQDVFASVSGSSAYFRGGVTAYHIDVKVDLLGVDRQLAESCGCVSQAVAIQMAMGVKSVFGTGIGVGTTGYAEPHGNGLEPYAFFAVAVEGTGLSQGMVSGEGLNRHEMRQRVVMEALKSLAFMLGA
jgi:nicotinamide-nucleotide amidase